MTGRMLSAAAAAAAVGVVAGPCLGWWTIVPAVAAGYVAGRAVGDWPLP